MNLGFIEALIVMGIMTAFAFAILHMIAISATDKIRDNVVNQIKSYDTLLQNKETELQNLKIQIENELNKLAEKEQNAEFSSQMLSKVIVTADAVYRNDSFPKDYRNVKEHFAFDRHQIVKKIYEQYHGENYNTNIELLDGLIDKFSMENVFKISAFQSEEQLEIIEDILTTEEKNLLEEYLQQTRVFRCPAFYQWLYMQRKISDRDLLVKTSENNETYEDIGEFLQTRYDKNLCEGIQIYVGNKLFDYGIKKYELIS